MSQNRSQGHLEKYSSKIKPNNFNLQFLAFNQVLPSLERSRKIIKPNEKIIKIYIDPKLIQMLELAEREREIFKVIKAVCHM